MHPFSTPWKHQKTLRSKRSPDWDRSTTSKPQFSRGISSISFNFIPLTIFHNLACWWILFDNIRGDREDHLYQWKLKIFENLHENFRVWGHFHKLCISSACKFSLVTVCTVDVYVKIIRYFTSMAIVRTFLCGCYSFLLFSVVNIFMHFPLDNYMFRVSVMFRTLSNI